MSKPENWTEQCIVSEDTPYTGAEKVSQDNTHSGDGMLQSGRVVWKQVSDGSAGGLVTVYADGIGLVSINSSALKTQ